MLETGGLKKWELDPGRWEESAAQQSCETKPEICPGTELNAYIRSGGLRTMTFGRTCGAGGGLRPK